MTALLAPRVRNSLLAALALLVMVATLDDTVARAFPRGSETLSIMELRSGGNAAGQAKVVVRRDHAQKVLELVRDPANPLGLTQQEALFAAQQVQVLESLLAQAMWSSLQLSEGMPEDRRARIDRLRADEIVAHTGLRAGPRWFMDELNEAFGPASASLAPSTPPPGWDPEEHDPEAWSRWRDQVARDRSYIPGATLMDFNPSVFLAALIVDQKDAPASGREAAERGAHARALVAAGLEVDRQWNLLESTLHGGGPGRAQVLPPVPTELLPPDQFGDIPLLELLRSLRDTRTALGGGP